MKKMFFFSLVMVLTISISAFAEPDAEGCADHPLFSRMKNYFISACDKKFDQALILISEEPDSPTNLRPEGEKTFLSYNHDEAAGTAASYLQIRRNYQNAAKTLKGKIIVDRDRYTAMQIDTQGRRIYVGLELFNDGRTISLTILEQEAMKQEITAQDMFKALETDGFMALYINFDTNQAIIKPESSDIIGQIIDLLKTNPTLQLSIEGHTDAQGTAAANKTLSLNRAKAVIQAVSQGGITPARMSAVGWGQEKPVADNRTEEGRAKNRRVEIVKK
jgi:OmpA-OmpF porin, OOP family